MTDKKLSVFLCHSSGDKPAVRKLYRQLCDGGFDPWLDEEKLLPGQKWKIEIPKAVRASDVVIVCLSQKSINKEGYVQKEIKFALDIAEEKPEDKIFIIPVRLEECDVPERLSEWQWVNLFEEIGLNRLMLALDKVQGAGVKEEKQREKIQETKIEFDVLKFPESISKAKSPNEPVDSDWSIQIRRPNKSIQFCSVIFNGEMLPWWNQKECVYTRFIDAWSSANVRIPKRDDYPKDTKVIVKDWDKTIWEGEWGKIPLIP